MFRKYMETYHGFEIVQEWSLETAPTYRAVFSISRDQMAILTAGSMPEMRKAVWFYWYGEPSLV